MVKNLKRTLAFMLSIIMVFSYSLSAFADDEIIGSSEAGTSAQIEETVEAEAPTEAPEVEVPTQEQEAEAVTEAQQPSVVPEIMEQPEDASVYVNAEAEFALEVNGKVKSCQWQMAKTRNGAWSNLSRRQYGSSEILKIRATKKYDKRFFRCIVTFSDGTTALSEEAQLKIVEKNVYPAQNFGSLKDTKVVAPEGAFPAGTTMEANEVADTEAVQSIIDDMDGVEGEVLAAVDISFYDGKAEIQPQGAVKVTMNVGKDVNFEELTLVHIKANADELDKDNLETETLDFTYDEEAGTITFDAISFSTYTITWGYGSGNRTTIHHGYLDGNNFVEFSAEPSPVNVSTNYRHYLIYDFDGYEYSGYTYYRSSASTTPASGGTRIQAQLRYSSSNWRYHNYSTEDSDRNWNSIANNSHIYVVYKAKETPTTGGTPVMEDIDSDDWPQDPQTPQFYKDSKHNADGTNTVSLSISGSEREVQNSTKANVIVVFDVSGSMSTNLNGQTRLVRAQNAVNTMANTLLRQLSGVKMALVSFSTTASIVQGFTDNYSTYTNAVSRLSANGGTNWEQALAMANRMAVDSDAATFIVFVTDGDPTYRLSRYQASDQEIQSYSRDSRYFEYDIFGEGDDDTQNRNFNAAADEVSSILANNKTFYAIGVSSDVTKVKTLVTQAGGSGDNAFLATDATALDNAFSHITQSIKTTLGFGDVAITDGITELANVEMKVMQEVDPDSFKYYKITSSGQTEWDPASEGCGLASYNSTTGAVTWNMGDSFQLEDGVRYMVTFRVWPSQEAYDLVADLNNGVKVYAEGQTNSITADERSQVVELAAPTETAQGSYALKTNTDSVSATYSQTSSTGDTVTVSGETGITATYHQGDLENMPLESMRLTIKKEFEDDLTAGEDRQDEVVLVLKRRTGHQANASDEAFVDYPVPQANGTTSANIVLNADNNWTYGVYVAPGFEVGGEVLEHGYDFTITEPDINYHYGLIEEIINPMVSDGKDKYYGDGYLLDDEATIQTYIDQSLTAVNRVKSGIDITKVVVDDQGNKISSDEEFTITGKILDPEGYGYTFNTSWDDRTDKRPTSQGGDAGSATWQQHQNDPIAYHMYDKDGNQTIYKGHFADTSTIQFTLKAGERIRFINVPENCTFEFNENTNSMSSDYNFDHAEGIAQHKVSADSDEWTTTDDVQPLVEGSKVYLPKGDGYTGVAGNKQYSITYTNKAVRGEWFYVYHSSDNKVEKIYTSDNRVTRTYANGKYTYEFDITREVKTSADAVPSYLYGGYYKGFGGQSSTTSEGEALDTQDAKDDNIRALTYSETNNTYWATDTLKSYAYTTADGVKATAWKGTNAYTAEDAGKGTAMHPVANGVYYLKEVPNSYLRPYIQVVYDKNDNNTLKKLFQITALDDGNYTKAGFYGGSGTTDKDSTQLSATIKITDCENKTTTLTARGVFNGKIYADGSISMPRGYLTSIRNDSFDADYDMQPFFITLDGVKVYGVTNRTVKPGDKTYVDNNGVGKLPGITVNDVTNKMAVE